MSSIPVYNIEENLRRIKMQKTTTFVVVEGADDIPIYESCLSSMAPECKKYDVIHSGGKTRIREFAVNNTTNNAIFLIDRDFGDIGINDPRIISLNRYSIENYFICKEVISHALQFALSCKLQDAINDFSLDEYITHINKVLANSIKAIFYYQKVVSIDVSKEAHPSWSDTFLCKNDSWELCDLKIKNLTEKLLPDPSQIALAEKYFSKNFNAENCIEENFPGKILKHSLQRYIRIKSSEIKSKSRGKFNDIESTKLILSLVLHKSKKLKESLAPVILFVKKRECL